MPDFYMNKERLEVVTGTSPVAQQVKNPPGMQEMLELGVWSLEKEMATHSSILAWKIPGTEEPGGLQSMGLKRVGWLSMQAQHRGNNTS